MSDNGDQATSGGEPITKHESPAKTTTTSGDQGEPSEQIQNISDDKTPIVPASSPVAAPGRKWRRVANAMESIPVATADAAEEILQTLALSCTSAALLMSILPTSDTHKFYSLVYYLLIACLVNSAGLLVIVPTLWFIRRKPNSIVQRTSEQAETRFEELSDVERQQNQTAAATAKPPSSVLTLILTILKTTLTLLNGVFCATMLICHLIGIPKTGK